MPTTQFDIQTLDPVIVGFYKAVLDHFRRHQIRFMAGGGFAFGIYSGITRDTKDFDLFVMPGDIHTILSGLAREGFKTELTDEGWLGKIFCRDHYVDLIFGFRNGLAVVDEEWFAHAPPARMFDVDILIVPPEEQLWSKCFVATRERYDGADIAHLLLKQAEHLDWTRLMVRFGDHWRLLYANLIMFGYIYPTHRHLIPDYVMEDLQTRLAAECEAPLPGEAICHGPLLSPTDYTCDVTQWGYKSDK